MTTIDNQFLSRWV